MDTTPQNLISFPTKCERYEVIAMGLKVVKGRQKDQDNHLQIQHLSTK